MAAVKPVIPAVSWTNRSIKCHLYVPLV